MISIHASLAGGDPEGKELVGVAESISIHASLAGGDLKTFRISWLTPPFQSTPPSREATLRAGDIQLIPAISIHASLVGGDRPHTLVHPRIAVISIHASLAGGDQRCGLRGAAPSISIHASLAGGDHCLTGDTLVCTVFQSTPPSREATVTVFLIPFQIVVFQSTPPSREATSDYSAIFAKQWISIHASLTGGDCVWACGSISISRFQSTPPSREATQPFLSFQPILLAFQSTPPSREATSVYSVQTDQCVFQSTPPSREATTANLSLRQYFFISIHASLAGGDRARLLPHQ